MNETLTVKDFGPIREAEVTFKRVTVFIGPTGGGKSTLAKLAAVFPRLKTTATDLFSNFGILNFFSPKTLLNWGEITVSMQANGPEVNVVPHFTVDGFQRFNTFSETVNQVKISLGVASIDDLNQDQVTDFLNKLQNALLSQFVSAPTYYIPAERVFYGATSSSLAGLMRDDIGLPKPLLDFVNAMWQARKEISDLELPVFDVKYEFRKDQDKIRLADREEAFLLSETASGIQSVAPLLVLLEHLSRQTQRPQSFIIEEPELNLFPEAQQALVQTLIEKCTQGENDLIITTHSPYVLTVLNTLMYAHKVAHEVPTNAKKVEKLIPRQYWVDPAQFAAYYVDLPSTKKKKQVRSIVDKETGMIGENELDHLSFTLADLLGKLLDLRTPPTPKATAKAQA